MKPVNTTTQNIVNTIENVASSLMLGHTRMGNVIAIVKGNKLVTTAFVEGEQVIFSGLFGNRMWTKPRSPSEIMTEVLIQIGLDLVKMV